MARDENIQKARALYRGRQEAKAQGIALRADQRAQRGPVAQLRELDRRLGAGLGAKRERARLARQLAMTCRLAKGGA